MTRVLLVGGGSAGHVAPMVAVAEALEQQSKDVTLTFVVSDKPSDAAFLQMEGRTCRTIPLPRRSLSLPATFTRAFLRSRSILRIEHPDVVFSKGGAVSVPLCLAARMAGIPIVLHESDGVMGIANRIVSVFAAKTLLGTDIGNPIRTNITQGTRQEGLRITGLSGTRPITLVMGGSQGAQAINDVVVRHLQELLTFTDVIHLTGAGKRTIPNKPGYYATEFGSDTLQHFYACADIAVSRAGAGSIAELSACGVPTILVPISGLAADHQVKNAERAAASGGVVVLQQNDLNAQLVSVIRDIIENPVRKQTLRENFRYASGQEASRLIAETVVQSVAQG